MYQPKLTKTCTIKKLINNHQDFQNYPIILERITNGKVQT